MSWPRDDAKLERVRALMAEQELDALVVVATHSTADRTTLPFPEPPYLSLAATAPP